MAKKKHWWQRKIKVSLGLYMTLTALLVFDAILRIGDLIHWT